jgi:mono/diheme cytochrome c family protein
MPALTWVKLISPESRQTAIVRFPGVRSMIRPSILFVFTGLTVLAAANGFAASIEDGRALAVEACGACHQVVAGQKRPAPVAEGAEGTHVEAPTFVQIADRCLSAQDLRARIANPHYPMREQELMPLDLDNLAAYIRSLSTKPVCAIR